MLPKRLPILILGGTSEANALVHALAGHRAVAPVLSLAGRTERPALPPISHRIGGFGGPDGLARFLAEGIGAVIDATHPFAERISANATIACTRLGLPLAVLTRAAWRPEAGDRWIDVDSLQDAVEALGRVPRHVFVTSGRLGLAAFRAAPQHRYLIRSIDPPADKTLPLHHEVILARPPFAMGDEIAFMRERAVDVLVTKNSGGSATVGKLLAARALGLPVVMVRPPARSAVQRFENVSAAVGWIVARAEAQGFTP